MSRTLVETLERLYNIHTEAEEPKDLMPGEPPPAADPAAAGMDPMAGGMGAPADEGPKSPEEVGRVYELKKIHSRLVAIEAHLSSCSSEDLLKLRGYVSKAVELFDSLISNVELYKDKLPDIIVTYYSFLESVYEILTKYYKNKQ